MFTDKVALVTGGSRGIGAATCRVLARRHAFVYINYHKNEAAAEQVLAAIREEGGNGVIIRAAVDEEAEVDRLFQTVRKNSGRLDFLVNNAGIIRDVYLDRKSTRLNSSHIPL